MTGPLKAMLSNLHEMRTRRRAKNTWSFFLFLYDLFHCTSGESKNQGKGGNDVSHAMTGKIIKAKKNHPNNETSHQIKRIFYGQADHER